MSRHSNRRTRKVLLVLSAVAALGAWIVLREAAPRDEQRAMLEPRTPFSEMETPVPRAEPPPDADRDAALPEATSGSEDAGVQPQAAIALAGQVADERGAPIAGANLRIADERSGRRSMHTDEEGRYSIRDLHAGRWKVELTAAGFMTAFADVDLAPAPLEQERDFRLDEARLIAVRIQTPAGEPIALAMPPLFESRFSGQSIVVVATRERPAQRLPIGGAWDARWFGVGSFYSARDASQRFGERFASAEADGLHGVLEVKATGDVWTSAVLRDVVLASRVLEQSARELAFVIAPSDVEASLASLRARIVDQETRAPLAGTRAFLHARGMMSSTGPISDADGLVRFERELPGERLLSVICQGYAMRMIPVRLAAGAELDLGDIALAPLVEVEGTVEDEDARPVAVEFWASEVPESSDPAQPPLDFDQVMGVGGSDARGTLRLHLPRGRVLIRAAERAWATEPVLVDTTSGGAGPLHLVLRKAVQVRILWEPVEPLLATIVVRDARALPVWWGEQATRNEERLELARGAAYALELWREGEAMQRFAFELADGPIDVLLDEQGARTFAGE